MKMKMKRIEFEQKKHRLDELVKSGRGIRYILNESYKIIGNPISLFDLAYNLLAYTEGVVTDDWIWNEFIELNTFSHKTVDFFKEEGFISVVAESETMALLKSDRLKYDRVNGKIFEKSGVQICNISCVGIKPFEQGDIELLEYLCLLLEDELCNSEFYSKIDRVYQETVLSELIEGKFELCEKRMEAMDNLYDGLKANLFVAVADILYYDQTVTHLAYFRDLFRKLEPRFKYYIYLNNIIILISTERECLNLSKDLGKLSEFFSENKIFAGVSERFDNLGEIHKYYRQAIIALNYGNRFDRGKFVFGFDSYRAQHFVCALSDVVDVSGAANPAVIAIRNYDKERGTDYAFTLYHYIWNYENAELTAQNLGRPQKDIERDINFIYKKFNMDKENRGLMLNILFSLVLTEDR